MEFLAEYAPCDLTELPNMTRGAELKDMGTMIKINFQNWGWLRKQFR